jgi:predicted nucleic acid-binding OB-fold protein
MDYNQLYELFSNNKVIHFKLYSLEYNIEEVDNKVVIYANYYEKNKRYFNSFEELMNNFNIYNEPLINQMDRIIIQ